VKPIGRILDAACRVGEAVAMVMLALVTVLILLMIVGRELLNDGVPWADELARLGGLGLIFLAAPLLLARDAHVKVDFFVNRLPEGGRRAMLRLVDLLTAAFCGLFLVAGWFFLQRAGRFSTPALSLPNLLFYLPAIVGVALLALVAVHRLVSPRTPTDAAAGAHGI
jgi:TRAP-type C4-dicarboxylate transport system permease small subunit